MDFRGIDFSG